MAVSHTKIRNKDTPNIELPIGTETATPNTAPVRFLHYLLPSYSDGMSTGGCLPAFGSGSCQMSQTAVSSTGVPLFFILFYFFILDRPSRRGLG